jgi:hypothetical protein
MHGTTFMKLGHFNSKLTVQQKHTLQILLHFKEIENQRHF